MLKDRSYVWLSHIKILKAVETLRGDGYVPSHNGGDGFKDVCVFPNSSCCPHYMSTAFTFQSYFNKVVKTKEK